MFQIEADKKLVNFALRRIQGQQFEYRHGCILGKVKLPLGAVNVVVIPSCSGSHIVFAIPFKEIKGDMTGKFFLSKLLSAFWGTISKEVESRLVPKLARMGLPRNTVSTEKERGRGGDVGKIKISLRALNGWLAGKHPRLTPSLTDVQFTPDGVSLKGELSATP